MNVLFAIFFHNQSTVHGGLFLKLKCTYKYPFYSFNVTFSLVFNGNAKFKVFSFEMYLHFHVNQVPLLTKDKGLQSSEKRVLRSTFLSRKTLQNLPYL